MALVPIGGAFAVKHAVRSFFIIHMKPHHVSVTTAGTKSSKNPVAKWDVTTPFLIVLDGLMYPFTAGVAEQNTIKAGSRHFAQE